MIDYLLDFCLGTLLIMFILCQLFTIWAIIEDIKQHNETKGEKENGSICRHRGK